MVVMGAVVVSLASSVALTNGLVDVVVVALVLEATVGFSVVVVFFFLFLSASVFVVAVVLADAVDGSVATLPAVFRSVVVPAAIAEVVDSVDEGTRGPSRRSKFNVADVNVFIKSSTSIFCVKYVTNDPKIRVLSSPFRAMRLRRCLSQCWMP